jgi:preprotein translocase subunit SecG
MNNWLLNLILIVHVLAALAIIVLVLLQHGKGADVGASFGSGSSGSLFGATGSANFLSRFTAILAVVFFLTSLGLGYIATNKPRVEGGVMDAVKDAPAVPVPSTTEQGKAADIPVPPTAAEKSGGSKANEVPK